MSHREWRETKRQPSRARSGHHISCCLVSLHFLCDILSSRLYTPRFLRRTPSRPREIRNLPSLPRSHRIAHIAPFGFGSVCLDSREERRKSDIRLLGQSTTMYQRIKPITNATLAGIICICQSMSLVYSPTRERGTHVQTGK